MGLKEQVSSTTSSVRDEYLKNWKKDLRINLILLIDPNYHVLKIEFEYMLHHPSEVPGMLLRRINKLDIYTIVVD